MVKKKLAIITFVKDEESNVDVFHNSIEKTMKVSRISDISYDIWYIDDGSIDNTLNKIKKLQKIDKKVHYVSFSRNFGKEAAIYAGLENTKDYDLICIMDADLQDPPELIPKMLYQLKTKKLDAVGSYRRNRKGENKIISVCSKIFYKIISKISSTHLVQGARDFRIMTRQVADSVLKLSENQRFSKGIFDWVGFDTEYIGYDNVERLNGKTKWGFWKLLKYAIGGIISFSTLPLTLVTVFGIFVTIISFVLGAYMVLRKLFNPLIAINGWTTLIVVMAFFGGIQTFSLGIVGRYVASVFLETKKRPLYILKEKK